MLSSRQCSPSRVIGARCATGRVCPSTPTSYAVIMDDIVKQFLGPNAWGGRAEVEHEPPDLDADAGARLVALLVDISGGQIAVTREDLRSVSTGLLLLMRETEDSLVLETRRLASSDRQDRRPTGPA